MSDLISRQASINLIERMKPYHQDADDIAEMIANMPSAQPERTGKWISADTMYYCDQCGEKTRDTIMGKPRWNFCPMCGARMEVDG